MSSNIYDCISEPDNSVGSISDSRYNIDYRGFDGLFKILSERMMLQTRSEVHCVSVRVSNPVLHSVVLLYFITRDINVVFAGSNMRDGGDVPMFADYILSFADESASSIENALSSIEIVPNPAWYGTTIQGVNQSYVCLSSSGTTGVPKHIVYGVVALFQNARNLIKALSFSASSRVLISVPINHMYGLGVGLLPAILAGASIRFIERNNVLKLLDASNSFKPSITLLNPTIIRMMEILKVKMPGGSLFISAGEILSKAEHSVFEQEHGTLINLYGSTEMGAVAISSLSNEIERVEGIVQPVAGVSLALSYDRELICLHNAGFNCAVNAEGNRILENPGNEWFKTNDVAEQIGADRFRLLGRKDNCVNRAGYLISLEYVETQCKDLLPGIHKIVAFEGLRKSQMLPELVAVCELTTPGLYSAQEIRNICLKLFSRYLVPDRFIIVEKLPLLNNGKPDRRKIKLEFGN